MTGATWILHVDLDQFLAAVEVRRRPELRGLPVVVGGAGDPTQRRAVVTCASYEARAWGVHAGMPLRAAARRCPEAVFLPSDAPAYEEASAEVMATLRGLPVRVEVWGWDEAFLGADLTGTPYADPEALASDVRRTVATKTGLSCAVGIGDNKLTAKLATGFAKPGGIYRLTAATWAAVMGERPTEALWGVGARTAKRLADIGIGTVADLAAADRDLLVRSFGPTTGPWILALGRGLGERDVTTEPRVPRSRSRTTTYPYDLTDRAEIERRLVVLADEVTHEVVAAGRRVARVAVTVRTATFFTRTRITTLPAPTTDAADVAGAALSVLGRFELDRPVRLLGVRVELTPVEPAAPDVRPGG